ncbi:hypothetical protein WICPIJ_003219 [Wickerhamomyces pijperi]|uniref:NADP-dependent oxidoreductase domain-containing protein n=1 Tax=Wickerhamomyces pijperi TaxID=599730 RepID=A0A9P8TPF5_WICPI|nr:hypothetical protein WICPIJ_003219 [Wickerhamomyces pijperi]
MTPYTPELGYSTYVEDFFHFEKKAYGLCLSADVYSNGYSEIILGKFLKKFAIKRDKVVILTKGFNPIDEDLDLRHTGLGRNVTALDVVNSKGLSISLTLLRTRRRLSLFTFCEKRGQQTNIYA